MDKKAGTVAPLPNSRWPTGGLTAPLSIIWKPQIYRMNSKFLSISSACQPSLPSSLPGAPLQTGSSIHDGILSAASVCFFQPYLGAWCFLCLNGPPPFVCPVGSNSLFKTWLQWNLSRYFPNTVTWLLVCALIVLSPLVHNLIRKSSVLYYNLRFLSPYSPQTWSFWVVTCFRLYRSRT